MARHEDLLAPEQTTEQYIGPAYICRNKETGFNAMQQGDVALG